MIKTAIYIAYKLTKLMCEANLGKINIVKNIR